ncbi:hypothetical protein [Tsukamurella spumae]|uniref:hypothetical protein n=1 Tax=Tsukamurella spumae TaxID=44753 RepID=UPI001445EF15|nr:hypothetical protein [Tsukamurella spumae]
MPRKIAALVAVIAIAMAVTGISAWIIDAVTGDGGGTSEHDGHDHGGGVAVGDARQVASSVLTTMYSWEPATDRSPADAAVRALPRLTGEAKASVEKRSGPVRPIALWSTWAAEKTLVTATVPADAMVSVPITTNPRTTTLRAIVTQILQPTTGAPSAYATFAVRVTLEQVDAEWLVSNLTVTDFG